MSGKKYRIRETSFVTYYSYIDTDDYPRIFNENGETYGVTLHDCDSIQSVVEHEHFDVNYPDFELFDQTFDYGIEPYDTDWDFTDYEEISEYEYEMLLGVEE